MALPHKKQSTSMCRLFPVQEFGWLIPCSRDVHLKKVFIPGPNFPIIFVTCLGLLPHISALANHCEILLAATWQERAQGVWFWLEAENMHVEAQGIRVGPDVTGSLHVDNPLGWGTHCVGNTARVSGKGWCICRHVPGAPAVMCSPRLSWASEEF